MGEAVLGWSCHSFSQVCINNTCHPHSVLGSSCDSEAKCHGHGVSPTGCWGWGGRLYEFTAHLYPLPWAFQVCNNKGNCHCYPGWQPPDCQRRGSRLGGSMDSGLQLTEGGECGQPGWDSVGRAGSALCPAGLSPARPAPAASTGVWGDGLAAAGLQPCSARPHRGPRSRPVAAAGTGPVPWAAATGHGGVSGACLLQDPWGDGGCGRAPQYPPRGLRGSLERGGKRMR